MMSASAEGGNLAPTCSASERRDRQGRFRVVGVLLVIGGLIVTAMFFVLYIRAISAERRADILSAEVKSLRDERGKS